jgi:hypothetical protein
MLDTRSAIKLGDATDPVSIEVLSDSTLLVLDRGGATEKLSRLLLYRDGKRIKPNTPGEGEALNLCVAAAGNANDQSESMRLLAYDFA